MKRLINTSLFVSSMLIGAATAVLVSPRPASAAPEPCPNIGCYFPDPYTLYCGWEPGWKCRMLSPDECVMNPC